MQCGSSCQNILSNYILKINGTKWIGNDIGFNFNSRDQKSFVFSTWKTEVYAKLYFYERSQKNQQKLNILISTTMECTNQLQLMFALKIEEKQNQIVLTFQTIKDVIKENQIGYDLFQKFRKSEINYKKQGQFSLLNISKIPQYFPPKIDRQHEIWFALRYMQPILLQQGTKIRVCFKPNSLGDTYQDLEITSLKLNYEVQQVEYEQIVNDNSLKVENQMNLLHIQQDIQCCDNKNSDCPTCLDALLYQNVKLQKIAVNVCDCSSGLKYKHLNCLIDWIKQKLQKATPLICEICLRYYPQYLQLTRQFSKGKGKQSKVIYLIGGNHNIKVYINKIAKQPKQGQIIIGNKNNLGFRVRDDQIIDYALIKIDELQQTAYIKDLKTKYGVLVKTKDMKFKINKKQITKKFAPILTDMTLFKFSFCSRN